MRGVIAETCAANQWLAESIKEAMDEAAVCEHARLGMRGDAPPINDLRASIQTAWLSAMAPAGNS